MDAAGPIPTIEELEAEEADNQDAGFRDDAAAEIGMSATSALCSNLLCLGPRWLTQADTSDKRDVCYTVHKPSCI